MSNNNLDTLFRTNDNMKMSLEQSKNFGDAKRKINTICKKLTTETQKYDPLNTVRDIDQYINSNGKLSRILYSEISNYIFSLEGIKEVFSSQIRKNYCCIL